MTHQPKQLLEQFAEEFSKKYAEWTTATHRDFPMGWRLLNNRKPFSANIISSALSVVSIEHEVIQFWGSPFLIVATEEVKNLRYIHLISCKCVIPPETPSSIGSDEQANLINGLCLAKELSSHLWEEEAVVSCGVVSLVTTDSYDYVAGASSRFFDCIYDSVALNIPEDGIGRYLRAFYNQISVNVMMLPKHP